MIETLPPPRMSIFLPFCGNPSHNALSFPASEGGVSFLCKTVEFGFCAP